MSEAIACRMQTNPLEVKVTRGGHLESRHLVHALVTDANGKVLRHFGDIDQLVYPRSANKIMQAIALVETGAAHAFGVSQGELALAMASHNGESAHCQETKIWLERLNLTENDLACGGAPSVNPALIAALPHPPSRLQNCCSGKHAGLLTLAKHLGAPTHGYEKIDHPVQQRLLGTLEMIYGLDLTGAPFAPDGCQIPTFAVPLQNLAFGFAQIAEPKALSAEKQTAIETLLAAAWAHPFNAAGTGRADTAILTDGEGKIYSKTGAEGVFGASLPKLGLGIAIKAQDGATRAAEVALGAILTALDPSLATPKTLPFFHPQIRTTAGEIVGDISCLLPSV